MNSRDTKQQHQQQKQKNQNETTTTTNKENMNIKSIWRIMKTRKKIHEYEIGSGSEKDWNLFELIAIGVGSGLGFGVYVLTGHIIHNLTGPSALVSFAIAGVIGIIGGKYCDKYF